MPSTLSTEQSRQSTAELTGILRHQSPMLPLEDAPMRPPALILLPPGTPETPTEHAGTYFDDIYLPSQATLESTGQYNAQDHAKISKILQEQVGELLEWATIEDVIRELRHKVYQRGIRDAKEAHARAVELATNEKATPDEATVRKWRSYTALRALAHVAPDNIDRHVGDSTAGLCKPDPQRALKALFKPDGRLNKPILDDTSLKDLLDIIALAEDETIEIPFNKSMLSPRGRTARRELTRRLITTDPKYLKGCIEFLDLQTFQSVLSSKPGALGEGRVGGKYAGILIAYAILGKPIAEFDDLYAKMKNRTTEELREQLKSIATIEHNTSLPIGSHVFKALMKHNPSIADCTTFKDVCTDPASEEEPNAKFERIKTAVEGATFPAHIERQLHALFQPLHGKPLAIRSSSELEDRFGAAFAGKYKTIYLPNCGEKNADYSRFLKAIKEIYASAFSPEVMAYREQHDLIAENEEMGVLIQLLNGESVGDFFHPAFAGVSMSHATESPSPDIDPRRGAMKVVHGLGETAVDSPEGRVVMFSNPQKQVDGVKPSMQNKVVTINTKTGDRVKINVSDLIKGEGVKDDNATLIFSSYDRNNDRFRPASKWDLNKTKSGTIRFDNMVSQGSLPLAIDYITQKLKFALGQNVDIEFTAEYDQKTRKYRIRIVQCRPLNIPASRKPATMPETIPQEKILLSTNESLSCGHKKNIRRIIYIPPNAYEHLLQKVTEIQHWVARLNEGLAADKYIIINPGRWGSVDDHAGIPARFSNFNKADGFFELVGHHQYQATGSFGTHFYTDVVEAEMRTCGISLAQNSKDVFNRDAIENPECDVTETFLDNLPSHLKPFIKVIDVEKMGQEITGEQAPWRLHIAQDNRGEEGRCQARVYIAKENEELPEVWDID